MNGLKVDEIVEDTVETATGAVLETRTGQTDTLNDANAAESQTPASESQTDKEDQNASVTTDSLLTPQDMRRARRIRVRACP